jgi:hypothetical protein
MARLLLDRDKTGSFDFDATLPSSEDIEAKTKDGPGTVTISFNFTPANQGDYYGAIGTLMNTVVLIIL